MPPKAKVTKEEILAAALELVSQEGPDALGARRLATALGCSTQPLFTHYPQMDLLRQEVLSAAYGRYGQYLKQEVESGQYPPYKASGMGYIRFARQESQLFRMLFMCPRTREQQDIEGPELEPLLDLLQQGLGISRLRARQFHLQMWIYVHGVATMEATAFRQLPWDLVSQLLTEHYQALRAHYEVHKELP